jgi:hypothetical protein
VDCANGLRRLFGWFIVVTSWFQYCVIAMNLEKGVSDEGTPFRVLGYAAFAVLFSLICARSWARRSTSSLLKIRLPVEVFSARSFPVRSSTRTFSAEHCKRSATSEVVINILRSPFLVYSKQRGYTTQQLSVKLHSACDFKLSDTKI